MYRFIMSMSFLWAPKDRQLLYIFISITLISTFIFSFSQASRQKIAEIAIIFKDQFVSMSTILAANPTRMPANTMVSMVPEPNPVNIKDIPSITLTFTISPTKTPTTISTPIPSATPRPTTTPVPAATSVLVKPTEMQQMNPEEFIRFYYDKINKRNYQLTWSLLSDNFKRRNHCCKSDGSFDAEPYKVYWDTIEKVDILSTQTIEWRNNDAIVQISLKYHKKSGSIITHTHTFNLVATSSKFGWQID